MLDDGYSSYLIASYNPETNECRSIGNRRSNLHSFENFKAFLNDPDRAPRAAIWYDEGSREAHIARELFGNIPLYYIHVPNRFFVFSSTLSGLASKQCVREFLDVDHDRIASYMRYTMVLNKPFPTSYYQHINLILPGHILKVSKTGCSSAPYVKLRPEKWSHLKTPADYSDAVRQVFQKSVATTIGTDKHSVASHLSGGIDSSSVSVMVRHIFPEKAFHTLFHTHPGVSVDDRPYSSSVADKIGSIHHEVTQSEDDFDLLKAHTTVFGQPQSSALSSAHLTTLTKLAKSLGCSLLLRGSQGDQVIGHGIETIYNAFEQKDWAQFQHYLRKRVQFSSLSKVYSGWEHYSNAKRYNLVLQNFLYERMGQLRNTSPNQLWPLYRELNAAVGVDHAYFLKRFLSNYLARMRKTSALPPVSILKDELISQVHHSSSEPVLAESIRGGLPEKYRSHIAGVFNPWSMIANDQQFALGRYYGIESRSPYADRDLFELCLAVPHEVKFGDGIGRAHLRNAMQGILPELVRHRSDKTTLASANGQEMTLRLFNQARDFLFDDRQVWEYVDRGKFDSQVAVLLNEKIPYAQKTRSWFHITRTVSLALWLDWRRSLVE